MKATGSQIRHRAVNGTWISLGSLRLADSRLPEGALQNRNSPKIVICLVGKGGVRFREPVCCAPDMATVTLFVLSNKRRALECCSGS
jgi:hypothetical protein